MDLRRLAWDPYSPRHRPGARQSPCLVTRRAHHRIPIKPKAALRSVPKIGPNGILSHLYAGGLGEVWNARDTRLDRTVRLTVVLNWQAGLKK